LNLVAAPKLITLDVLATVRAGKLHFSHRLASLMARFQVEQLLHMVDGARVIRRYFTPSPCPSVKEKPPL
jgi:hypothetical protein